MNMAEICFVGDGEPSAAASPKTRPRRKMECLQLNPSSAHHVTAASSSSSSSSSSSPSSSPPGRKRRSAHHVSRRGEHAEEIPNMPNNNNNNNNNDNRIKYGVTSVCGRRREMEDTVSAHPSFATLKNQPQIPLHFLGVFDGHGCSHVSMSCRNRMHEIVKEEIIERELGDESEEEEWRMLMARSFGRMDDEVKEYRRDIVQKDDASSSSSTTSTITCRCELRNSNHQYDTVGSTALVAVLTPDKLIISNCGDSRAVLCRNTLVLPLSSDHKPDRPDELSRIESTGGRVIYWDGARVLGVLATSRAIGDGYLKPYVISEPEVVIMDRTAEDEFIILASDGLWDVISNETACEAVQMLLRVHRSTLSSSSRSTGGGGRSSNKSCSDASIMLTKLAMAKQSSDNISVVVIDLRRDH